MPTRGTQPLLTPNKNRKGGYQMNKGRVYSKIHSLRIQNFMAIKDSTITFTDDFVNLKGMNSRGKSATNKAFRVIMTHYKANKQRKWIKWGENFFRLTLTLENGTSILYEKRATGKSKYEIYNERDELVFSTYVDGVYAPIVEVPEPVQQIIGVIKQGSLSPNFMKSREPLFIVDTTGKQNDEYLRGTLEPEDVTQAQELVQNDIKNKRSDLKEIISSVEAYQSILNSSPLIEDSIIDYMERKDNNLKESLIVSDSLQRAEQSNLNFNSIVAYPAIDSIDDKSVALLRAVDSVDKSIQSYTEINPLPEVTPVPNSTLTLLDTLRAVSQLTQTHNSIKVFPTVDTITQKEVSTLQTLESLDSIINKYNSLKVLPELETIPDTSAKILHIIDCISLNLDTLNTFVPEELPTVPVDTYAGVLKSIDTYQSTKQDEEVSTKDLLEVRQKLANLKSELSSQNLLVVQCEDCGHLSILDSEGNSMTPHTSAHEQQSMGVKQA